MLTSQDVQAAAQILRARESSYPGGDLTTRQALAATHVQSVIRWFSLLSQLSAPHATTSAGASVVFNTATQVSLLRPDVAFRDGAGLVALQAQQLVIARDAKVFTTSGLAQIARSLSSRPLNPLVALRWTLTDLLLRYAARNVSMMLTVVDYSGSVIVAPYARGFAIGSGAVYSRAYTYGQPLVNVGFDDVSVKILASRLSAGSQLSYAANTVNMAPFVASLDVLDALLSVNKIGTAQWLSWYLGSAVAAAAVALTQATHRTFKPDLDPSHVGANVDRNSYGYNMMKAISMRDASFLRQIRGDFTLPSLRPIARFSLL